MKTIAFTLMICAAQMIQAKDYQTAMRKNIDNLFGEQFLRGYYAEVGIPPTPSPSEVQELEQELLAMNPLQPEHQSQVTPIQPTPQLQEPKRRQPDLKASSPHLTAGHQSQKRKALIIGDSMIKHIEPAGLDNCRVITKRGATIASLQNELFKHDIDQYETLIIHCGTNNISSYQPVPDILEEIRTMVGDLMDIHSTSIVLSGVLPRYDLPHFNKQIQELNIGMKNLWPNAPKNVFMFVDHQSSYGQEKRHLFHRDGLHVNKKGTSALIRSLNSHVKIIRGSNAGAAKHGSAIRHSYKHDSPLDAHHTPKQPYPKGTHSTPWRNENPPSHPTSKPNYHRKSQQTSKPNYYSNSQYAQRHDHNKPRAPRQGSYNGGASSYDENQNIQHEPMYHQNHSRHQYPRHRVNRYKHQEPSVSSHQGHAPTPKNNSEYIPRHHPTQNNMRYSSRKQQNYHINAACEFCGEENHRAKNCRHGSHLSCRKCGELGHKAKHCSWY